MNKKLGVGKIREFEVFLQRNVFIGAVLLVSVYSLAANTLLNYALGKALLGGLMATLAHYASEFVHQLGHNKAASKTGYPMNGILFVWVLASSLYPKTEGELPAEIHLKRAIGGPIASFSLSILFALLALLIFDMKGLTLDLMIFISVINFLVFCMGALLPLGFTDGSTILKWWPQRGK